MMFKKTLPQRIFSAYKFSAPSSTTFRIASSTMAEAKSPVYSSSPDKNTDPRRFLHQSLASSPEIRSLPIGEKLREKLCGIEVVINARYNKMRLINEAFLPPWIPPPPELKSSGVGPMEDVKKILRLTQFQILKSRLRKIEKSSILFSEFIEICKETCLDDDDQGLDFAKKLDESGDVIVLGNVVFLRPDQVGFVFHILN